MVHPECNPSVIDLADEVLSTGGMVNFVKKSCLSGVNSKMPQQKMFKAGFRQRTAFSRSTEICSVSIES